MEIGLLVFGMTRLVKGLFDQEGPLHPLVVRGRFGIHKAPSRSCRKRLTSEARRTPFRRLDTQRLI